MAPVDFPRPRILIIDDEESTRLLLARMMSAELAADVQLAGTCEQAMKLADQSAYDLILLDLLMPGVGGVAILRDIRAGQTNLTTPLIVVSVVSDPQTIEECLTLGANAYHVKPVRRLELVDQVRRQLASRPATVK
jgi:DNA-binding response OmpR family regulator